MDVDESKTKFEQAAEHLKAAKSELNRPAEDVVPFMVCRSSRYALSNYLKGFLSKHRIDFNEEASVAALLEKCTAIDKKFKDIDLSVITFTEDDEYTAAFDEMENCIDLAEQLKQLVGA